MFNSLKIDLDYHEDLGGGTPYHYSYVSGMDEDFNDGYFQLYEINGDWYYRHVNNDYNDYNGGVFHPRMEMFIELMEWY